MARPSAETITSKELDYYTLDIMASEGYWLIAYKGLPVSLRQRFFTETGIKMKYPRTGFNNRAHCENLARRLNKEFNTKDFACIEINL